MNEMTKSHARSKQVLLLLKEYGPLSFRGLRSMIEPAIKERRLHDTLARLVKRGFVVRRHERLFRGAGIFYQLCQTASARLKMADLLDCSAENLLQPQFRRRELLHAEACALWAFYFRKCFQKISVLRDYEIQQSTQASRPLLSLNQDPDLEPDLLLLYKTETGKVQTSIAVEIERSQKSDARLLAKLKKYANGSLLDGVVYVCESERIERVIRLIYQKKVMHRAHRIKQYGNNFLLFCRADQKPAVAVQLVYNSDFKNVSLSDWLTYLSSTQRTQRRDENFKTPAVSC